MPVGPSRIWRGEVRNVIPTPEFPDPAEAVRTRPKEFMSHWMSPAYPYPQGYNAPDPLTIGQHWTHSPQTIPERFSVEGWLTGQKQSGVPMGKRESSAILRQEQYEGSYGDHKTMRGHEQYLNRAQREGINTYRDLSGGDPDRPGAAKPYRMSVVWEGKTPERFEHGTNYEDELDLPHESHVEVTGARLYVPPSGGGLDLSQHHPSVWTPEEHAAALRDAVHRSTYSHLSNTSRVPWSRVQFEEPIQVPIARQPKWRDSR